MAQIIRRRNDRVEVLEGLAVYVTSHGDDWIVPVTRAAAERILSDAENDRNGWKIEGEGR